MLEAGQRVPDKEIFTDEMILQKSVEREKRRIELESSEGGKAYLFPTL